MKKIKKIIRTITKEVGYLETICDYCGKSVQIEDDKEVFFLILKRGVRGLRERKEWKSIDRWYFCKKCLLKQIKLEFKD